MANTNTDLTEEDAADLQFPKDQTSTIAAKNVVLGYCSHCYRELLARYIFCDQCKIHMCLECFAAGSEFGAHKNDHNYRVFSTDFLLFENSDWTAEEELQLLESLHFYGNWNLVALNFPKRNIEEIKEHYEYFYLNRNGHKAIPIYKAYTPIAVPSVPYRLKTSDSDDPPRYAPNTVGYQSLAGYNAPRGDFENEFDKNAEDLIAPMDFIKRSHPDYEIMTNLQYAIIQCYNDRLRERERRKNLIAKHGLLVLRRNFSWLNRFDSSITKDICQKLIRFMHLAEPTDFEMLMEGLNKVGELRIRIQRLLNLRLNGIRTLDEGRLYFKLHPLHQECRKQLKIFRSKPQYNWKSNKNSSLAFVPKVQRKKPSVAPLDIIGMPGYEKLTEREREMCASTRLVPATYLDLKETLIVENDRAGCVKLQRARSLLKIDVNKTRKLYDFLVGEGFIKK